MSSYIFADPGLGRARRLGWRRYGVIPLLRSLRRQRLQPAYWQGQFAGAKGTHAPAHASLRAVRRRVGASRASAHKLRAPERLCHKSDTICSAGDVGLRLDAKPTRILAAWRPWRNGSRPGRITWGARARAIGAHAGGSTPPKAIVRGDCKEGLFASGVPLLVRGGRRRRTKCCSRGMPPGPGLDPEKNAALPRLRRGTQDDA
jgi:hypothetical protein